MTQEVERLLTMTRIEIVGLERALLWVGSRIWQALCGGTNDELKAFVDYRVELRRRLRTMRRAVALLEAL